MQSKQARNMKAKTIFGRKIMHKGWLVQDLNNYGVRMFGDLRGFHG